MDWAIGSTVEDLCGDGSRLMESLATLLIGPSALHSAYSSARVEAPASRRMVGITAVGGCSGAEKGTLV